MGAEEKKIINVRVTPAYQKALKIYLAEKELTMQEYIKGLIDRDLKEHREGGIPE